MKYKILLAFALCAALLAGCGNGEEPPVNLLDQEPVSTTESTPEETTLPEEPTAPEETTVPPTAPEISPDVIGLYIPATDGSRNRNRQYIFDGKREMGKDIDCFEVLISDQEVVAGSGYVDMFWDCWNNSSPDENAKIGFHLEFDLADGTQVSQTLLKPSDSRDFFDYLEIYMYDDVNAAPGWYSHLEDDQMKENTLISSIKLTAGSKIAEVGDIRLTAFVYTGDDCFDANGNYIGTVSHSITLPG